MNNIDKIYNNLLSTLANEWGWTETDDSPKNIVISEQTMKKMIACIEILSAKINSLENKIENKIENGDLPKYPKTLIEMDDPNRIKHLESILGANDLIEYYSSNPNMQKNISREIKQMTSNICRMLQLQKLKMEKRENTP